jgi:enediyne biosynthesis protein E4
VRFRKRACLGYSLGALAMLLGAMWAVETWRFEAKLGQSRRAMTSGDYSSALPQLRWLSARRSGRAEVDYLLGVCEQAAGRPDAALAAWARVRAESAFTAELANRRAQLEMERGRFATAEEILLPASQGRGPEAIETRQLLAQLLLNEGRVDEAAAVLEANWMALSRAGRSSSAQAVAILRSHITLDLFPLPVEYLKALLSQSSAKAPEDDRLWLAQANLATRIGRFDAAERWLDACVRTRPDDPAVWRAVMEWELATDRGDRARQAAAHLPVNGYSPQRLAWLRAWFAARRGDARAEERALELVLESDPGVTVAVERLAELAARAGQADRAAALHRRKAELDSALDRYKHLYNDANPTRNAREMSRLAGQLGRRFEERGFLALAARSYPEDRELLSALARLEAPQPSGAAPGQTLAELLATDAGSDEVLVRAVGPRPRRTALTGPRFRDDAQTTGLHFVLDNGASSIHQLPEMACGGVGLLDYNSDGWFDVYCVQGGPFPPGHGPLANHDRLFRNTGHGTFEDVSAASGIAAMRGGYGQGVAVGDVDNDGRADLFVTRWRSYALYRNTGNGTFDDVTDRWGLGGHRDWPTSAAFADFDADGDLDLYVCHYAVWDPDHPRLCQRPPEKAFISCAPYLVKALPDRVYRNDGGRFIDVTAAAGIADTDGRGLGVVAADLDLDGKTDLFVANDGTANFLFRNKGGFQFEEVGQTAGVASSAEGGYQAGMGVACGDLDADGKPDLVVTNFYGESTSFYQNLGGGLFADRTAAVGLAAPSRFLLGFGVAFLDADADGWLDLLTVNGHVNDFRPQAAFAMPAQLLLGEECGRLTDISAAAGEPFQTLHLSRGLAVGDLDNDGRVDALVVNQNEPLAFFHNGTQSGHFVTLLLEGSTSNRDGVGARVTIDAGGRRQTATRFGGGSYQSAGDPRLHFGLGAAERVARLEVCWPSGRVDRYEGLAANTGYLLREGGPKPERLKGWKR